MSAWHQCSSKYQTLPAWLAEKPRTLGRGHIDQLAASIREGGKEDDPFRHWRPPASNGVG